ncbi:phytoene/squalene synthase family protein [Pontivivens ytuae]|uniref:Squalene/phytoene synthase family protein n=1 Tax=Pontivivens ytuae TaxID=2789856 RepID=A0A7S9LQE7_9RHOB|nr:squalene/phytoene synthase family protein [Pontivivens ytuae]QPH53402.1 squalene/phytoene synthase family protein [Pontivivens ytuae]
MSWQDCAELVERGDPDRYLSAMTAPLEGRARLFPLYAFNLEVARAPWVTSEAGLAEIRLQWWRDAVGELYEGATPRRHEVVLPLGEIIGATRLPRPLFDALIDARAFDIYDDGHPGRAGFDAYLAATGGGLMELAVRALGAPDAAPVAREAGWAQGAAGLLAALPVLWSAGRDPLPVEGGLDRQAVLDRQMPEAVARAMKQVAEEARTRLSAARRQKVDAAAYPALRAAWQADRMLARLVEAPEAIFDGLAASEFRRKGSLLVRTFTGRW